MVALAYNHCRYKQISDVGFSHVDFSGCFSNSVSKTKIFTPI